MTKLSSNNTSLSEVHETIDTKKLIGWRRIFSFFGPAYLVSVGYMDPGNWATDLAGGSKFGYSLIWVLLMSNLMALLLQSLSARLGIVRGRDLAQANREAYPKPINFMLWILAEIAIAACDLAEVLGMAIGIQLLTGLPLIWGVSITVLDTFLLLYLQKLGMRKMEAFIITLVAIVANINSDYHLLHEQVHFDITRLGAENFIKQLVNSKFTKENYEKLLNSVFDECYNENAAWQQQYDKETSHSINKTEQLKWNYKIATELKKLQ